MPPPSDTGSRTPPAFRDMDWTIKLVPEPRHVRITLYGTLSVEGMKEAWEDIFSRGFWRKNAPLVFDLASIEVAELGFGDIEIIVGMLRDIRGEFPGGRLRIIAGAAVQFGKTRQYQTLADLRRGLKVDIFKTEAEALDSLLSDPS